LVGLSGLDHPKKVLPICVDVGCGENGRALGFHDSHSPMEQNVDANTVDGFGEEWGRVNQSQLNDREQTEQFERYFEVFPWESLPASAEGFDLRCGSGRLARFAAKRVRKLHCIDASAAALAVARRNLELIGNIEFHEESVDAMRLPDGSMDFGYSLGVLHYIPDTSSGIRSCSLRGNSY
jgi:SAM-dependent methyltransferase